MSLPTFILRRLFTLPFLVALSGSWLVAGTITGRIVLPMSTHPLAGATLSFTLSQAAAMPGSYLLVPETVLCYTTADGSVVGLPDPVEMPSAQAQTGNGSLPAGLYFIRWAWLGASGESLPGPELQVSLSAPGSIQIQMPSATPFSATGYAIYIGAASGQETQQYSGAIASYAQSVPLQAGANPPTRNDTLCSLNFNDATIPAPTYYLVNLADAAGNQVAGFPQSWYLAGSSVDVSQIVPLSSNPALSFPQPILSNPSSAMPQSIASPLQLNGYPISGASNLGPGFLTLSLAGALPPPLATLDEWVPNAAVSLRRISLYAALAGAGGATGLSFAITDGVNTCTFAGLLPGAQLFSSAANPAGGCDFNAGLPLTLQLSSDDHTTRPANVDLTLEMTSR